ncbi:Crp/Fnr family transcriptional regulator [Streptomyces sp. WAC06614]|uniref:Crp/Fnr family transcriptional regulator n=1 Tax=Streptomyces sp. WAC06614 TaxID=2487416 RepID=UPI000F785D99|nr:cyclic nucleotide-binding domain-containing protein [Streptomyces sp. WAC06614]RSS83583.1 cyclic nucleotide-binding domain-containing protein [Streptomyces sp. WAC06614]
MRNISSRYFDYGESTAREKYGDVRFLADLPDSDWARLAKYSEARRYSPGSALMEAGAGDQSLYLLTKGLVGVVLPGQKSPFKEIDAPSVLGEVSFIDGGPRSLSLVALSECEALRLSMEAFEVLAAHEPELGRRVLIAIARVLAMRLRSATELINQSGSA